MELFGKRWPEDFTNRFFIGQHTVDHDQNDTIPDILKGIQPREIVRQLADIGCDTLYFYMSCHLGNCYYPTKVKHGRVHSGIGDLDVFGEAADECVKRQIAMVAVFEFMHLHYWRDWEKAPEGWKHYTYGKDGKRRAKGLCWNTGYGDFVLAQVKEVFSQYPLAGLYVDMLDYPGLELCPGCARRFREEMGEDPPQHDVDRDSPLYKEYLAWTFRENARFLNQVRGTVREHAPGAIVIQNYHAFYCKDLYELRDATDFVTQDPTSGFGYRTTARPVHTAACFRALSERKLPFDILLDNVVGGMGLLQMIPRDPYLGLCATVLAHGGYPVPDSMWDHHGRLNPAALGVAKEAYRHVERTRPWVGKWKSLKAAGVYLSQESKYFYGNTSDDQWDVAAKYMGEFHGALLMTQEEHVLRDVLTRNQLPRLSDYAVIYLPNAVCLSDVELEAFRNYVREGGTLVSSYRTSLADEWGRPRGNFGLADLFGVDGTGEKIEPYGALQMKVEPSERFPFLAWENPMVTLNQAALLVTAREGAQVTAQLHDRYRPSPNPGNLTTMLNAFVREEPSGPAIVESRCGKGRSIYFAGKVFSAYLYKGSPEVRKLAARWLVADEVSRAPVRLEGAPGSVEMTAYERPQEGRWIVHLVNFQSIPGRCHFDPLQGPDGRPDVAVPLTEHVIPVHDLVLKARTGGRALKGVTLQPSGEALQVEERDGVVAIRVPKVHIHEVVVLEFAEAWESEPERFTNERLVPLVRCPRA
ncbi:MAG: beta-galactosidase trimerization domain-containing protein [Armatimonadetes bacterium]|nr:beta-galactosidase trimerization domain-containing protein [Armatimonadota bacterium]